MKSLRGSVSGYSELLERESRVTEECHKTPLSSIVSTSEIIKTEVTIFHSSAKRVYPPFTMYLYTTA